MWQAGPRGAGPFPLGAMALLGAAVLAAHLLVLSRATLLQPSQQQLGAYVFSTRMLSPPAPAQPPAATPPAMATPVPRPPPRATAAPREAGSTAVRLQSPATPAPAPSPSAAEPVPPIEAPASVASAPQAAGSAPTMAPEPPPAPAPPPVVAATATPPSPADPTLPAPSSGPRPEPRAYAIPGSVLLKFNATGQRGPQPQQASGQMLWQHDGQHYEARMEIGAWGLGARTFTSAGALTADGLAPQRFADKRRTEVAAHFDRDRARIVFSANTPSATLVPGAQDQLSIFIQLASMVAGEPQRYLPGTQISLQTVGPRAAENWIFEVEKQEELDLPGGRMSALKLVRKPGKDYDQQVELWLAPALSWLPARIRISFSNGDYVDQQWRTSSRP